MKWIAILFVTVISIPQLLAQSKTKARSQDDILKHRIDSVDNIIVLKSRRAILQTDSATHALYVQVLERTSNIQNNRDTYYSFFIAALTLIITVIGIAFAFNWYAGARRHKKEIKHVTELYEESVLNNEVSYEELRTQSQKEIENLKTLREYIENKMKEIEAGKDGNDQLKDDIGKLNTLITKLSENQSPVSFNVPIYKTPKLTINPSRTPSSSGSTIYRSPSKLHDKRYNCSKCKGINIPANVTLWRFSGDEADIDSGETDGFYCKICGQMNSFSK